MQAPPKPQILEQALALYHSPFFDLVRDAHHEHRRNFPAGEIQKCALLSVKTGGCPEDCAYCPQSAHYKTGVAREALLPLDRVKAAIREAKEQGASRFCLGAAWRDVKDGSEFDRVLEMVREIKRHDLEACVTLGMLTLEQAKKLKEAGLDAYNHNLDTSPEYYPEIIRTRTYADRLQTLRNVSQAGVSVCSGGILGLGEDARDRCGLLTQLAALDPQPESVPINLLIPIEGTPLAKREPVDFMDLVRTVAVARILMPRSRVRLSAGRTALSREAQLWCFYAGANSLFLGEKLLTSENPSPVEDRALLDSLGALPLPREPRP